MVLKTNEMKYGQLYKFGDEKNDWYVGKFFEAKEKADQCGDIILVVKFDDNGKIIDFYRGDLIEDPLKISGFTLKGWRISPSTCNQEENKEEECLFIAPKYEEIKGDTLDGLTSEIKEFYRNPEEYYKESKQFKKEK